MVLAVSHLCVPSLAAGSEPVPVLTVSSTTSATVGSQVTVRIDANVSSLVADGKLTVRYNPSVLTYERSEVSTTWANKADVVLSDNPAASGQVVLAFAGTNPAETGEILVLHFRAKAAGESVIALGQAASDNYISGVDVSGGAYTLAAETTITVADSSSGGGGGGGGGGNIPVPDDPTQPSGSTSDEPCDGGASCPSRAFTDVAVDSVYHEGIDFMVENGYMNGVSATSFKPEINMDRAMIVTILYRMAGAPSVSASNSFSDVKSGDYYYDAVRWALENKITEGVSSGLFNPGGVLTRVQIAAFLYRYAEFAGYDTAKSASLSQFGDGSEVSSWAQTAMEWAVGSDVIKGTDTSELKPGNSATREQIAVMVWRLVMANQG